MSVLGRPASPTILLTRTLAWFDATFTRRCACLPLDVRLEGARIECGKCGSAIVARAVTP